MSITTQDWTLIYQARMTQGRAISTARQVAKVEQELAAQQKRLRTAGEQLAVLEVESASAQQNVGTCADADGRCAAARQIPGLRAQAQADLQNARAAVKAAQDLDDRAKEQYVAAQTSWNAWLETAILMIINQGQVADWTGFRPAANEALVAAKQFVDARPDQALQAAVRQLQAPDGAVSVLAKSVRALSDRTVQARGEIPEQAALSAGTPAQPALPTEETSAPGGGSGGGGVSVDPLGLLNSLITVLKEAQQQQAIQAAEARKGLVAELREFMWPAYECLTMSPPNWCRTAVPGAGGSPVGKESPAR